MSTYSDHAQHLLDVASGEELDRLLFRTLNQKDQTKFRAWARAHYQPGEPIPAIWHPVVRDECAKMNGETMERTDAEKTDT